MNVRVLDNKIAIVTGAGKGIGKHEAIALAKAGAAVTVCARTLSDVEKVSLQKLKALVGRGSPWPAMWLTKHKPRTWSAPR